MQLERAREILTQHEPARLYEVAKPAIEDSDIRQYLVENSFAKSETLRYNCVRVLFRALERDPLPFYPYWDLFASMIDSPNGFHRSAASQAIAFLSAVDVDCRLDKLLKHYMTLLEDPKVMVAHYFIETLDRILRARPEMQEKVLRPLLGIDRSSHTQQHKDMLKADILGVLERALDVMPPAYQKKALAFALLTLDCTSPKARKAAKAYLALHPGQMASSPSHGRDTS